MNNSLYPLKFSPIYKSKIWGGNRFATILERKNIPSQCGESWELSAVTDSVSVVSNGFLKGNSLTELLEIYMGDLVGDAVYKKFGNNFPLLIKFIDAADDLSVQVHPDDTLALKRHNSFGKTEMWYVVDAEPDAKLVLGFNSKISKSQYLEAVENNSLNNLLNYVPVKNGDVFFVSPGCVHAIGKGCFLLEIQQTSDITYRIYDYNRRDASGKCRELHTELAVDAVDFDSYNKQSQNYKPQINKSVNVVDCNYFTTNVFEFDKPIERDYPEIDSFIIYMCVSGSGHIEYGDNNDKVEIAKGDTVLIPAAIKNLRFFPTETTKLVEVYLKES